MYLPCMGGSGAISLDPDERAHGAEGVSGQTPVQVGGYSAWAHERAGLKPVYSPYITPLYRAYYFRSQ